MFYLGKTDYFQSTVIGFSLAFADKLLIVTKLLYDSDTDTQEPGRWSVNHSICPHRYLFSVRNLLSWCMKLNPTVILLSVSYPSDKAKRGHRFLPLWPQLWKHQLAPWHSSSFCVHCCTSAFQDSDSTASAITLGSSLNYFSCIGKKGKKLNLIRV